MNKQLLKKIDKWPNLFIPGAAKSGTSSLHAYLGMHPAITTSRDKEPAFFNDSENFHQRKPYYLNLFEEKPNSVYRAESSTAYMTSSVAIQNIKRYTNQPKFIFILRNPIDRAFSHYKWLKNLGYENLDFDSAISQAISSQKPKGDEFIPFGDKQYFRNGLYAFWISTFVNVFGIENINVITTERLKKDPLKALNICFRFLEIDPFEYVEPLLFNYTDNQSASKMSKLIDRMLYDKKLSSIKKWYATIFSGKQRIELRNRVK